MLAKHQRILEAFFYKGYKSIEESSGLVFLSSTNGGKKKSLVFMEIAHNA